MIARTGWNAAATDRTDPLAMHRGTIVTGIETEMRHACHSTIGFAVDPATATGRRTNVTGATATGT
eukprot:10444755-Prorocentrum_lima.AAC.1